MAKTPAIILYDGPSQLTGEPIMAVLTGCPEIGQRPSANSKTGRMGQVWIIERGKSMADMRDPGRCTAVCGTCPMKARCYVTPMPVASIQRSVASGKARHPSIAEFETIRRTPIRWGAFGDPNAIPKQVVKAYLSSGDLGYTHNAWAWQDHPWMCSVESADDAGVCWDRGARTFRVLHANRDRVLVKNEVMCPAWKKNSRATCKTCRLCSVGSRAKSVTIPIHGARAGAK